MGTAQKRRSLGSKTTKYEHGERPDNGRVGCPTISKRIFSSTPLIDGAVLRSRLSAQLSDLRFHKLICLLLPLWWQRLEQRL